MRYKIKCFLTLLCFSINCTLITAQWIDVESPVKVLLRDVCFSDSLNGWAIGDSSAIINTNDGGYNWNIQNSPIENLRFNRVQFTNENVGYISAEKGVILSTKDGGSTWISTTLDTLIDYRGLSFIKPDTGWVAGTGNLGDYVWGYYGQIQRTTDGGITWQKQYGSDTTVTNPIEDDWFTDIKFINAQVGYALTGAGGTLYSTTNGGHNWEKEGSAATYLARIDVAIGDTVWGCGELFVSTVDNGLSWISNAVLGGNVRDISMINGSKGYVLANRGGFDQRIMYTENRGETFKDIWIYGGPVLTSMFIDTENNFICSVGDLGRITINRNFITDIYDNDVEMISEFKLHQNYPNPFNSTTTISYSLPKISNVSLIIYDMMGREVKVFEKNRLSAGVHSFVWMEQIIMASWFPAEFIF